MVLAKLAGSLSIQWIRAAMTHITKWAAAGAFVAHDHECGRALAKAFTNVGAAGFFANCDQFVAAEDVP